jgi:mRNA interferase RelE/StbE
VAAIYRLLFTARARKDIDRLDTVVKKRLRQALETKLARAPLQHGTKLVKSNLVGEYRFRVGDYRVIYDLEARDIIVLRVQHRREVYRPR